MPRPRLSPQQKITTLVWSINQNDRLISLLSDLRRKHKKWKAQLPNQIKSTNDLYDQYRYAKATRHDLTQTLKTLIHQWNEKNLQWLPKEILEQIHRQTGALLKSLGQKQTTAHEDMLKSIPTAYHWVLDILSHPTLSQKQKKKLSARLQKLYKRKDFNGFLQQLPDQLFLDIKNILEPHHTSEHNPYFSSTHAYDPRPPFEWNIISAGIHN